MNRLTLGVRFPIVARVLVCFFVASAFLVNPVQATQAMSSDSSKNPSRIGLVADVGTRYGIYGQQKQPIEVLSGRGAKWVKEEFRWDWVQPSRDQWTWAFMDEAVNE